MINGNGGVWLRYVITTILAIVSFFGGIFIGPPVLGAIKDSQVVREHERRIGALEEFKEKGDRWTASQQRGFEREIDNTLDIIIQNQMRICDALEIKCADVQQ